MEITTITPKEVFSIFHEITRIPRPSKHEEQICQWLQTFAKEHNIEYTVDDAMNVIMRVPATAGYESHEGVILQAHMDMVCEKNNDTVHDFSKDPIETYVDGDWLKAKGTTLGGDDGIGIALALAAITSPTLQHPAIECLFTVDEETGLTGAFKLKDGYLTGKRLINLDSEDDGQIFIGCAGGIDTLAKMHYSPVACSQSPVASTTFAARIFVTGLTGGHSGDDINKGRANANKIIVRFLYRIFLDPKHKIDGAQLSSINGGNLRNAIARECEAVVLVPMAAKEQLRIELNHFIADIEAEYGEVEKDMVIDLESLSPVACSQSPLSSADAAKLIRALYACPHGVIGMCKDMPGLVETSTNLASIKMKEGYIEINTSQRSSVESKKHDIKNQVECALAAACDEVTHGDGYPGWAPNVHSAILETTKQAYIDLFKEEPKVLAIHAGLECGLFLEKYPYLDMVSIGPQMVGVHSPQERLSISSTGRCWQWLQHTLEML
ncbi:MAG: aminoacyl-histidine dipeptidase [Paludibacteraceae bacterium]|nr:aminoacyl-histidine dipeptidase [Paludibacteraceae bacterium]